MMGAQECLNLSVMSQKKGKFSKNGVFSYHRSLLSGLIIGAFMNLAQREFAWAKSNNEDPSLLIMDLTILRSSTIPMDMR